MLRIKSVIRLLRRMLIPARFRVVKYRIDIPEDLYIELTKDGSTVEGRFRNAVKWVLLENAVRKDGGAIYVQYEPESELVEVI